MLLSGGAAAAREPISLVGRSGAAFDRGTDSGEKRCLVRRTVTPASWVVYRATFDRKAVGMTAVCEQEEWEAMERDTPGHHTLVKGGIPTEGEAEQLARAKPPAASPASN